MPNAGGTVELHDLTSVLSVEGPFVTVHVLAQSDVQQAGAKYELEWKSVLQQLEQQGVGADVRDALSAARGEHADGPSRLVVASIPDASVRLSVPVSSAPATSQVHLGPLPHLLALLTDVTTTIPHIVLLADRRGADVQARYDTGATAGEVTVSGRDLHVTKVAGGGWSHLRYQHRAEKGWADTAYAIVTAVDELAGQIDAQLVLAAGDQRELQLVRDALPERLQPLFVEVPGGRGGDGGEQQVQQRVRDALARHLAAENLDLLDRFAQERGQHKRACDGVEDVVAALRKAQVETLLLTTATEASATLWFGTDPAVLGCTSDEVTGLGDEPREGPLLEVLVRAAVATGAEVQLVPHEPEQAPRGGVGAVLRYSDQS